MFDTAKIKALTDGELTVFIETLVDLSAGQSLSERSLDALHDALNERAARKAFAATTIAAAGVTIVHTRGGDVIGDPNGKYPNGIQYGQTHDADCPGCKDTPFTASPRSETYWAS